MEDTIVKLYKTIMGNKVKTYAYIAGAVIAIILICVLFYYLTKKKDNVIDKKHNQELAKEADEEIVTERITLTQMQFNALASKLYNAMKGLGTHTEEDIFEAFGKLQTRADVLQLIKTYGIRDGEDLNQWLLGDLNSKEMNQLNQILVNNGINYMF